MLRGFPIPQKLIEVGLDRGKIDFVANEIAAMKIIAPRSATAEAVRALLQSAIRLKLYLRFRWLDPEAIAFEREAPFGHRLRPARGAREAAE